MSPLLQVEDLEVHYGKIAAVKGIGFHVDEGEVVTLIGTNGAGKTTTLRTISGLLRPTSGSIRYKGRPIDAVPPHKITGLGIAHSPEGRRIFPRMTVEENLMLGAFQRRQRGVHAAVDQRRRQEDRFLPGALDQGALGADGLHEQERITSADSSERGTAR